MRSSTPAERCSSPTTTATCRSSKEARDSAAEVAARYRDWSAALAPLSLAVQEIGVSPRGGWRLRAIGASGPLDIELGRDEPGERLARFVSVYGRTIQALTRTGTRVDRVDLRYRNGFAAHVPGFRERAAKKTGTS